MITLPEIPLDIEETEVGFNLRLFTTTHTGLAAILYAISEVVPVADGPVRGFRDERGVYYTYYFQPSPTAEHLARCYRYHRQTVELNPDNWFSRVLDVFHNRQRLIELIHAAQLPLITKRPRRLYFDPSLSSQHGPGGKQRRLFATDGRVKLDDLKFLSILMADDGVRLQPRQPLTVAGDVLGFNFEPSQNFTDRVQTLHNAERFVAANPEHWVGYALGALNNYAELIHERLPLIPIQPKSRQVSDGSEKTFYLQPKGNPHAN